MVNREKLIINSADRRRKHMERNDELSLSHWRGELHAHERSREDDLKRPAEIIEKRSGSNCGKVPIEALTAYHSRVLLNEYLAITDHARDSDPARAVEGITGWFSDMYLNDEEWLKDNFAKAKTELTEADLEKINSIAEKQAKELTYYGDERIRQVYDNIDHLGRKYTGDMKVLKGIEASLLPDGNLDADIDENCEWVNCSIHPSVAPKKFEKIINDPEAYTELVLKGMENPKVNNFGHIGYECARGLTEKLNWDRILKSAVEHKVAIEINLKELMEYIYDEMLDYDKYPKDDKNYLSVLKGKLPELIPLLSSDSVREKFAAYFPAGLKISINTDEHENPFIDLAKSKEGAAVFIPRDFRFWRCLKVAEGYFNDLFSQTGIKKENIINTFDKGKLLAFARKAESA